ETTVAADSDTWATTRFAALGRPGTVALRVCGAPAHAAPPLVAPRDMTARNGRSGAASWMVTGVDGDAIAAAAVQHQDADALDRVAAYQAGHAVDDVVARAGDAAAYGFDRLLADHRAAWGERWRRSDLRIDGDDELQLAVRFS